MHSLFASAITCNNLRCVFNKGFAVVTYILYAQRGGLENKEAKKAELIEQKNRLSALQVTTIGKLPYTSIHHSCYLGTAPAASDRAGFWEGASKARGCNDRRQVAG